MTKLLAAIEAEFGTSLEVLLSRNRKRQVALARHIACYLAHTKLRMSSTEIGQWIGRHHVAVLHGVRRVENEMETYEDVAAMVQAVKERMRKE